MRTSLCNLTNSSMNTLISDDISMNSIMFNQILSSGNDRITNGIISYAADKLNIREGDSLFLLPRIQETNFKHLYLALLKREPEWWITQDLS